MLENEAKDGTVDDNDDAHAGMLPMINYEEIKDEEEQLYIVDECSLLRHSILSNCYRLRHRRTPSIAPLEDTRLFSKMPPPDDDDDDYLPKNESNSELDGWLEDSGYGLLRDTSWVLQTQKAHKASPGYMKVTRIFYVGKEKNR